jgi:recombination protein RecA
MAKLSEITKKVEKEFGKGTFVAGNTLPPDFSRIPTGIFAVDWFSGGGIPVGVSSSLWGGAGAGKSVLTNRIMAGAQNICWNCFEYLWDCKCKKKRPQKVLLLPIEGMDSTFASQMGVDMDELIVAETSIGEEAVDVIVGCLKADDIGLIVLDSLAMLTPQDEMNGSAFDNTMALQARLISSMMRKIKTSLVRERKKGHPVAFLATNQIRAKIGGFGHIKEDVPGGNVAKHDWHLTLRMSQLKSAYMDAETELPLYTRFKASNVAMGNKRKCFTIAGAAEYYIVTSPNAEYKVGTIYDEKVVLSYLDRAGLLQRKPTWKVSFMPEEFKTKAEMIDAWNDLHYFLSVKKKLVQHFVDQVKADMG